MTEQRAVRPSYFLPCVLILLCTSFVLSIGCKKRSSRPKPTSRTTQSRATDSAYLIDSLSSGLNNLPREIVLNLQPPAPILDDSKSADGQPVMAACDVTPAVPDGPNNFLYVPKRNANFRKLGVRRGDIVRYFIDRDRDSAEHGIAQVGYVELTVRRLDTSDPNNALIFEGGLPFKVEYPERIEIWRFSDKRMGEINQRLSRYIKKPKARISWEPAPDESALRLLLDRANQWLRNRAEDEQSWKLEPLVNELPTDLRDSKPLAELLKPESLEDGQFDSTEARQLQQAIWLRDVSRWAKGEATTPLEEAKALFDWTVRNIQLDSPDEPGYVHQPWQALMYGHGTAKHRAWVFAELCRQQQLDVVMLSAGGQWWLPALFSEGQLYLFDASLGLPIAGTEPGSVATLAQVKADPALLRQLDLDAETQYPITEEMLENVVAAPIATPLQLAKRSRLLEQQFKGDDFVVLSSSTQELTDALGKNSDVSDVQLWAFPFESILAENNMNASQRVQAAKRFLVFAQRPRLWKARVLHFQGTKDIPLEERNDPLAQPELGHQEATRLYQSPRIRPPNAVLEKVAPGKRDVYVTAKADASYWLGSLSYDLKKYKVAEDWLAKRVIKATPDGFWVSGARYNLARTYEAMENLSAAIKLLEADEKSPQRHGNLLRARLLQQELSTAEESEDS